MYDAMFACSIDRTDAVTCSRSSIPFNLVGKITRIVFGSSGVWVVECLVYKQTTLGGCSSVNNIEFHINIYRFRCNQQSSVGRRPSVVCGFQLNRFKSQTILLFSLHSTVSGVFRMSRQQIDQLKVVARDVSVWLWHGILRDFYFSNENSILSVNFHFLSMSRLNEEGSIFVLIFLFGQTLIHLREDDDKVQKGRMNWTNNRKKGTPKSLAV